MKNEKKPDRVFVIFALLRAATVVVAAVGTWLAYMLIYFGLFGLSSVPFGPVNIAAGVGVFIVVAVSVCCYVALVSFFRMCGRLAKGSAFTEANLASMRRISLMLFASGAAVAAGLACVTWLTGGGFLALLYLWSFVLLFFGGALLAYALTELLRRAVDLQQEISLTI